MSRVAVKPQLLRWARERSGVETDELVQRFPKYKQWERGEAQPTLRQLEGLAKKTLTPLGYFFLAEPPEDKLPIPDFRTVRDAGVQRPSPNLLETIQIMQRRKAWMRDFLIEQGEAPLAFFRSIQLTDDIAHVALRIREVLGMTEHWARSHPTWTEALRALRNAAEQAGILVVINGVVGNNGHRQLDPAEFRGFVLGDEYAPLIFVNGADAKAAQMFTIAHELVHVWLGREGVFDLLALEPVDDEVEKFCNRVAAEFLIPARELTSCWPEAELAEEPFQYIARRFKVSPLVAARRALDLALSSERPFSNFGRNISAMNDAEQPDDPQEGTFI